ncbi:MAG: T9SS type A sorting domain-containing protein [Bacteroidales bacterium]
MLEGESGQAVTDFVIHNNYMFAGNIHGNVLKSSDFGKTWQNSTKDLPNDLPNSTYYSSINELYSDGSKLYACTDKVGLFYLDQNGQNWRPLNNGLPDTGYFEINSISSFENIFYLYTDKGVYYSSDYGSNWNLDDRIELVDVWGKVEVNGSNILILNRDNVYRSIDYGNNWEKFDSLSPSTVLTSDSSNFYFIRGSYGFCRLAHSDSQFVDFSYGFLYNHCNSLFKSDSLWLLSTYHSGLYVSTDNGAHWNAPLNSLVGKEVNSVVKLGSQIFAATDNGIFISIDNGSSWNTHSDLLTGKEMTSLEIHDGRLYSGGVGGVFMYDSLDHKWSNLNVVNSKVNYLYSSDSIVYVCTESGLYSYNPTYNSCEFINSAPDININSISKFNNQIVLSANGNLYFSQNNGLLWENMEIESNVSVEYLTNKDSVFFAATNKGVYANIGFGHEWINLNIDYQVKHVLVSNSKIYASTSAGLYNVDFNRVLKIISPINEFFTGNDYKIYPNPFKDYFFIDLPQNDAINGIRIYSVKGALLFTKKDIESKSRIMINDLNINSSQTLILEINTHSGNIVRRKMFYNP